MPRRTAAIRKGVRKPVPLKLPPELAVDLQAFCEAHFNAPQNQVICAGLRALIEGELERDIVTKERFIAARERILQERNQAEGLRLVSKPNRPEEAGPDS